MKAEMITDQMAENTAANDRCRRPARTSTTPVGQARFVKFFHSPIRARPSATRAIRRPRRSAWVALAF